MFRFEHSEYLYLLTGLPLLLGIFIYYSRHRKKSFRRFGKTELITTLIPDIALRKSYGKFFILLVCAGLFILTIAGPRFGHKLSIEKRHGMEVMICLDISNSMLSPDICPTRLDKAKQMLSLLIDKLDDDKIGLIVFAGDAFIQLPITSDYISAKMFLSSIHPSMIAIQGTAIGKAIHLALKSFTPNKHSEKSIILITDGENHEDNSIEAAKEAIKKNITVCVLGIGSIQGSPIPISGSYLKDKEGNIVLTKLNESMCQEIARVGKGMYIRGDNTNRALKVLQKELNKKSTLEIKNKVYSSYDEKYFIPAWSLLILLVIEFFILERKNSTLSKIKFFL